MLKKNDGENLCLPTLPPPTWGMNRSLLSGLHEGSYIDIQGATPDFSEALGAGGAASFSFAGFEEKLKGFRGEGVIFLKGWHWAHMNSDLACW
jgi:hypothetical protein